MTHTEDELWSLLAQSHEMPYGAARIALVEQVMAHADAQHLEELQFAARMSATDAYVYGGERARSFVTFSWCVAEFDRDPLRHRRSQHHLLWQFKATISGLSLFPEIPLDRTYAVLDDMERRWRDGGHSLHAVYAERHSVERHLGNLAAAEEWYQRWVTAPRDELSDCAGCDPSGKVYWLVRRGRYDEAITLGQPVLAGRLTCSEQPQGMLTNLLLAYLRTNRLDEARDAHRRAYRRHRPNLADLADIARHIEFCAVTGNEARGLEILQRHLRWLDKAPSPFAAMQFSAAGALLLRGTPPGAMLRRGSGDDVASGALRSELTEVALDIAGRFDERNGSAHVSGWVRELMAEESIVDDLPLSPTARAGSAPSRPANAPLKTVEAFSKSGTTTAKPAETLQPEIPEGGPDALLDVIEDHLRRGRRDEAFALCDVFDERYAGADLTGLQRGRRADAHGVQAAVRGDDVEAETAWRSAVDLFAAAGDELRRQSTRGRIGRVLCGRSEETQARGLELAEESATYLLAHAGRERWPGALYSLAMVYGEVGRADEGLSTLERAEEYAADALDPSLRSVIAIGKAQFLGMLDLVEEARAAAEEASRLCRAAGFAEGLTHASFLTGLSAERLGDFDAALAAYDEAVATAGDPGSLRQARLQRAGLLAGSSRAVEAIDDFVEEVADRTAAADADGAARARHGLAIAYLNAERPLDSAEVAEEALGYLAERRPDDGRVLPLRHLLAAAYQRLSQPDEAIAQLDLIAAACAESDNPAGVGQMNEEIGDILDRLDRDAAAALRYLTAAEAFRTAELRLEEFRNRRQHAVSLLWSDDLPAAHDAMGRADELSLDLPDDEHGTWERASLLYDGARILRGAERLGEAALRAGTAARTFRDIGFGTQAAHAELLLAELLLTDGRAAEAAAAAERGLADLPEGEAGLDQLQAVLAAARRAQQGDASG